MTNTAKPISRRIVSTLIGGIAAAVFALAAPAALAVNTGQGYQISPPVSELNLDPGTTASQSIQLTNLTDTAIALNIGKENFVAKGEEGQTELTNNADPLYSLAPWFTIGKTSVTIPPAQTVTVPYTLTIPANAEPGGRYGSITATTVAPKLPNGESGASVSQVLASLILLRINGPAHEQLKIASFKTSKSFYQYGPVSFSVVVQNVGNVHEKPTGQIVIKNIFGMKTATLAPTPQYVLPGADRLLAAQLNNHFMFGRYTATLTLKNGGLQTLTAVTSFWVIPINLVIIFLVVVIILTFLYVKTRKRFARAFRILAGKE
jgi:hypothetical protein